MERYFNITGCCNPQEHYMVNLDSRLAQIKKMVDRGQYFCINRGRQYGKTTLIMALESYLEKEYIVHQSFQQKECLSRHLLVNYGWIEEHNTS